MGDNSAIEWTEATWNPVTGCDRCSPGCDNCYALTLAKRLKAMGNPRYQNDGDPRTSGPGFKVTCHPDALDQPARWTRPRHIFVNSMSDLFHPDVLTVQLRGAPFLAHVFARMVAAEQHTFQILTKRPQLMAAVLSHPQFRLDVNGLLLELGHRVMPGGMTDPSFVWPANLWLGTSIETDRYTFRADHLRATPAAVRFVSAEPLLGPLPSLDLTGIDWLIAGGESGHRARPMHPDWVRDLRDRCTAAGTAFFFKQWGEWAPGGHPTRDSRDVDLHGRWQQPGVDGAVMVHRAGKNAAGRELDGATHSKFPSEAHR